MKALGLAMPDILDDSIKITRTALQEYRKLKKDRLTPNGVVLCDHDLVVTTDSRINRCISNMPDAQYTLKHKYFKSVLI